ncbi:UNVERIFIED_CONTAM: hypothetical protein FKN15_032348 [Acipenser sinensis]
MGRKSSKKQQKRQQQQQLPPGDVGPRYVVDEWCPGCGEFGHTVAICPTQYQEEEVEPQPQRETKLKKKTEESFSLKEILKPLENSLSSEVVRYNITRRNVWDGTVRAMSRPNFSPTKQMDIKFTDNEGISEGAVDLGGPKREFLRLVLEYVRDHSGMFEGPQGKKNSCLQYCSYFYAGQLMVMSIIHGGPPPQFLSLVLTEALICGPDKVIVSAEDMANKEIHSQIILGRPQVTLRGCRRRWMEPLTLKALRWSREIPNVSEAEEGPSPRAAEGGVPVLKAGQGGAGETACQEASGRNCLPSVSEGGPVVRGRSSQKEAEQSSGEEPPGRDTGFRG